MKKTNKILAIILAILMVMSIIPITASAATYTGACGDNATWNYDSSTYTLTISGTGDMYDYEYNNRPWESYKTKIKSIFINDNITKIGAYAFHYFTKLESVEIPNSVITIGKEAFSYCKKLTSVLLSNKITIIDEWTFAYCESLTNITIPRGVTSIGDYAFSDCYNLVTVTIPDSVTTIGKCAFQYCENLTNISIPDSVITIGETAFLECSSITDIIVDNSNQYFSSDEYGVLFNKDKTTLIQYPIGNNRADYTIPDSVTTIDSFAFYNSENLVHIVIPDWVTTIGDDSFAFCYNLTDCNIGESVTTIGKWAFAECYNLTTITVPDSVVTIDDNAFYYCYNLLDITLGKNITTIGSCAFYNCNNLTSVIITDSVTSIGFGAFSYCYSLTDVYYCGTEEDWDNISISNNNSQLLDATIHYNYTPPFTGIKDNHFYKDDVMQKAYQLVEFDGDFYYIGDRHQIVKDKKVYIKEERLNGLTYSDGTPLTAGTYEFDENGKMVILNGLVGDSIYKNNAQLKAYQLVEVDGDFYYIGDRHQIVKDKKVYIKEERLNGLTYRDGTPITAGTYTFDENGKMVILNGLVGDSIYKNNVQLKAYQLVEVDGDFYYIGDRHQIVKDKKVYIKEERLNGLTYSDGTTLTAGYYTFDANGKMIIE